MSVLRCLFWQSMKRWQREGQMLASALLVRLRMSRIFNYFCLVDRSSCWNTMWDFVLWLQVRARRPSRNQTAQIR